MFKNRALLVRPVKIAGNKSETTDCEHQLLKDDIVDVANDLIKQTAVAVVSVIVAVAIMHVASEIAIHHGTNQ